MMKERWKTIKSFPNYMISDHGRVWSKPRVTHIVRHSRWGGLVSYNYHKQGQIRRSHIDNRGYRIIALSRKGVSRTFKINRLVAKYFVRNPKPKVYNVVNHKDENQLNNYYKNLEWCTQKYNVRYSLKRHPNRYIYRHLTITPSSIKKRVLHEEYPIIAFTNHQSWYFNSETQCASYFNLPLSTLGSYLHQRSKVLRHKYHLYALKLPRFY